jgi:hypothetical protein
MQYQYSGASGYSQNNMPKSYNFTGNTDATQNLQPFQPQPRQKFTTASYSRKRVELNELLMHMPPLPRYPERKISTALMIGDLQLIQSMLHYLYARPLIVIVIRIRILRMR